MDVEQQYKKQFVKKPESEYTKKDRIRDVKHAIHFLINTVERNNNLKTPLAGASYIYPDRRAIRLDRRDLRLALVYIKKNKSKLGVTSIGVRGIYNRRVYILLKSGKILKIKVEKWLSRDEEILLGFLVSVMLFALIGIIITSITGG